MIIFSSFEEEVASNSKYLFKVTAFDEKFEEYPQFAFLARFEFLQRFLILRRIIFHLDWFTDLNIHGFHIAGSFGFHRLEP